VGGRVGVGIGAGVLGLVIVWPVAARAESPAPELLARLSTFAETFETLRARASYTIDGRFEISDGSGKVESVKTMTVRAEGSPTRVRFDVLRYTEDGVDKTKEARAADEDKNAGHRRSGRGARAEPRGPKPPGIPILASEQGRYVFDVVEIDRADPARVRIAFVPKRRSDDTIEGSAWVDSRTGALISAAFKLDGRPTFVDFIHVVIEFGASTPIGPAISSVRVDGEGGFLFFRKRFHASATFFDYRVAQ
jgi:hypothetical protein